MFKLIRRHRWAVAISTAVFLHLAFIFTAYAQVVDPSTMDPSALVQLFFAKVQTGDWKAAIALVVVAAVWAMRRWGGKKWPALKTDRWGAVLTLASGVAGGIAWALNKGGAVDARVLYDGITVGLTAAGGYTVVKRILWPSDAKKAADAAGAAAAADPATVEKTLNR